MGKLGFVKMVARGNDFVVVDNRGKLRRGMVRDSLSKLAKVLCQRKTGVGADGLLILEKSKKADFKMRIFNADGSEAEMCGNGLRCAAWYAWVHPSYAKASEGRQSTPPTPRLWRAGRAPLLRQGFGGQAAHQKKMKIETIAGMYEASVTGKDKVKIKMQEPKDIRLDVPVSACGRSIKVNYIDMGVPHIVVFVQGIDGIDVDSIGRNIRYHPEFEPRGANVDFVEIVDAGNIRIRTYERGVEGETLACGTGAVAAAIVSNKGQRTRDKVNVHTKGGILTVFFNNKGGKIKDVYLEGEAKEAFGGEVNI